MTPGAKKERPGRGMKLPGRAQATDERTVDDQNRIPDSNKTGGAMIEPTAAETAHEIEHETPLAAIKELRTEVKVVTGDITVLKVDMAKVKVGLIVVGGMVAVPKLGGPTAQQAVTAVIDTLGDVGSIVIGVILGAAGLIAAVRNHF